MQNNTPQKQAGYTLLETLVAVLVLTFALVAPLSIASRALFSSTVARAEVTAFYLAQESIEAIRNMRDQNGLTGDAWNSGFSSFIGAGDFTLEVNGGGTYGVTLTSCGGTCPKIKYDPSTHLYQYGSGSDSIFTRTVRMDYVPNTVDEISISVTISWNVGLLPRSFTARDNIYNWQ